MPGNDTKSKQVHVTHRQHHTPETIKKWDGLGHELLTFWQQAHGAPEGTVSVMAVQNGLLVFMENAFSQAELALAQQSTDNLLQQYIVSLTHQILPVLVNRVAQVSGRQIGETSITPNIEQNWMVVFFRIGEPISTESKSKYALIT